MIKYYLKQAVLKYHFVMQPEGEGPKATDDRSRDSILEKKSVTVIRNTDNNCFWNALAVALNMLTLKRTEDPKRKELLLVRGYVSSLN